MQPIEAEVYSYGGCSSCGGGNNLYGYFKRNNVNFKTYNAQITYKRQEAINRARDLGATDVHFPVIFIGGKVVIGFKPDELNAIINEIREG